MSAAVDVYHSTIASSKNNTVISIDTDMTNRVGGTSSLELPLIPDVTIQYRCGDNIQFSYMYGILPFTAFSRATNRVPVSAKCIYVVSDHPSRAPHAQYTSRCQVSDRVRRRV